MSEEKKRKVKRSLIIGSTGLALTGLGLASLAKAKSNKPYYVTEVIPPFEGKDHSESNPTPEEAKAEKKRKIKKGLKIAGGIALGAGALGGAAYLGNKKGYSKGLGEGIGMVSDMVHQDIPGLNPSYRIEYTYKSPKSYNIISKVYGNNLSYMSPSLNKLKNSVKKDYLRIFKTT